MSNVNNVDLFSGIQNRNQKTGKEITIDESLKKSQLGSVFAAATSTAVNAKHKNISFWDKNEDGKLTAEEMRIAITEINKGNRKTRNSDKYTGKKDIFKNGNTNTTEEKARFYALNQAMNYNWYGTTKDTEKNNQFKERQAQIEAGERDVEKSTRVMLRQLLLQENGLENLSAEAEVEIGDTVDFTKMTKEQTGRSEELSDGVKKALNTTFKGKRIEGKAQIDEEGNTIINFKDGTSIKLDKDGNKVTEYFNKDTNIATYEDTDAANDYFEKKTTYSLDDATKKTLKGLNVTQITTEGTKKTISLEDGGKVVIDSDNVTRYDKDGKEVNINGTPKPAAQPVPDEQPVPTEPAEPAAQPKSKETTIKDSQELDNQTKELLKKKGLNEDVVLERVTISGNKKVLTLKNGHKIFINGDTVIRFDAKGTKVQVNGQPLEGPNVSTDSSTNAIYELESATKPNFTGSSTLDGVDGSGIIPRPNATPADQESADSSSSATNGTGAGVPSNDPTAVTTETPNPTGATATTAATNTIGGTNKLDAKTKELLRTKDIAEDLEITDVKNYDYGTQINLQTGGYLWIDNNGNISRHNDKNEELSLDGKYFVFDEEDNRLKEGSTYIKKKAREIDGDAKKLAEFMAQIPDDKKALVIALLIDQASFGGTDEKLLEIALDHVNKENYQSINSYLSKMSVSLSAGTDGYGLRDYIKSETSGDLQKQLLDKLNEKLGYQITKFTCDTETVKTEIDNVIKKIDEKIQLDKNDSNKQLTKDDASGVAALLKISDKSKAYKQNAIYLIRDIETLNAVEEKLGMPLELWIEDNYQYTDETGKDLLRHINQLKK